MQSNLLSGQRDITRPTTATGPDFDGCSHGPDDQIDCPIHIEFFQCTAVDVRDNVASLEISQSGGATWQQFRNLQTDGIRFDFDADPNHVIFQSDTGEGVGYLKLEQFADSTMNEIDAALMSLHQRGMKSLIIDLLGNPGGLLTTAIALSDRFLPSGTIVATRGRTDGDNSQEKAHFANTWKMPLVVLVDHNSASASEIFAAAIQENHRGVIVGEKSYGKGTVQTLFPLQTFPAALRLTTAKFYSPDGREMAGSGVTPDVKVVVEPAESHQGDEALSEALRQISSPKTRSMSDRFRRTGDVSNDLQVAA